MEKLSDAVWKLQMDKKVEIETITDALTEACNDIVKMAYLEGPYGRIERIDTHKKETIIFMSGNERTAKTLLKSLEARVPGMKINILKVRQADIMKFT